MIKKILRKGRVIVVIFEDKKHCSKVYNDIDWVKAHNKASEMERLIIERKNSGNPFTLEELTTRDKKKWRGVFLHRFCATQPRYQDKKSVERMLSQYNKDNFSGKDKGLVTNYKSLAKSINARVAELEIPIILNKKTTVYVRESRILCEKWINELPLTYPANESGMQEYINDYKKSKGLI